MTASRRPVVRFNVIVKTRDPAASSQVETSEVPSGGITMEEMMKIAKSTASGLAEAAQELADFFVWFGQILMELEKNKVTDPEGRQVEDNKLLETPSTNDQGRVLGQPSQGGLVTVTKKDGSKIMMTHRQVEKLSLLAKFVSDGITVTDDRGTRSLPMTLDELQDVTERGGLRVPNHMTEESVPVTEDRIQNAKLDFPNEETEEEELALEQGRVETADIPGAKAGAPLVSPEGKKISDEDVVESPATEATGPKSALTEDSAEGMKAISDAPDSAASPQARPAAAPLVSPEEMEIFAEASNESFESSSVDFAEYLSAEAETTAPVSEAWQSDRRGMRDLLAEDLERSPNSIEEMVLGCQDENFIYSEEDAELIDSDLQTFVIIGRNSGFDPENNKD